VSAGKAAIEKAIADAVRVKPRPRPNGKAAPSPLDSLRITSAAVLTQEAMTPVRYLVSERIPRGLVLLVARPKMRKSWLALQAMVAAASGGQLLGKPATPGRALGLMLEDNDRRMSSRLAFLGVDRQPVEVRNRLHFAYSWPKGDEGVIALHAWMELHPDTGIIVVDVLQRFRGDQDNRKGAYALDYQALEALHALAKKYPDLTVLVVHHTRKGGSDVQAEKVSGTFGIVGAADAYIILDTGPEPGTAAAHIDGRDWELWTHDFVWRFDENGWQHVRVETSEDELTPTQRKRLGNTSPSMASDQCMRPAMAGFQTCDSSSSRRCSGVSGSRSSTSRRYA